MLYTDGSKQSGSNDLVSISGDSIAFGVVFNVSGRTCLSATQQRQLVILLRSEENQASATNLLLSPIETHQQPLVSLLASLGGGKLVSLQQELAFLGDGWRREGWRFGGGGLCFWWCRGAGRGNCKRRWRIAEDERKKRSFK